jgi:uncharacterized phiE125 gp8 family phage protein
MEYSIKKLTRTNGVKIVTLAQAKANSKIEYNDEDAILQLYVDAIEDEIENITGITVVERNIEISIPSFPKKLILPVAPVTAVVDVKYFDTENEEAQTLAAAKYQLIGTSLDRQKVLFNDSDLPTLNEDKALPVTITVKAGYTNDTMPEDIKRAALLMFGTAENYREDMPLKPHRSAYAILKHYKLY